MKPHFLRQRGFTRFELGVVVTIFAILATVLLSRLNFYQQEAEKASVRQLVIVLRSSLKLQALRVQIDGQGPGLQLLEQRSPLDWLAERPANDLGELYAPDVSSLPSGNWFFDKSDQKLVYLLRNRNIFSHKRVGVVKFKVILPHVIAGVIQQVSVPDIVALEGAEFVR